MESTGELRGLIVDWGGVLTAPMDEAIARWAGVEGIASVVPGLLAEPDLPIRAWERGELSPAGLEQVLASRLRAAGLRAGPEGLLARMLEGVPTAGQGENLVSVLRRARATGLRTALLSNTENEHYPEHLWIGAFDQVVLSGRVGLRKPEAEIFRHTAKLLGLPAQQCVFVDDQRPNVVAAAAIGMVGVHFTSYPEAVAELEILFGLDLR